MATMGRVTPTNKPVIAPKPRTRPETMTNQPSPDLQISAQNKGKRKSKHYDYHKGIEGAPPLPPNRVSAPTHHNSPGDDGMHQHDLGKNQHTVSENGIQLSTLVDTTKRYPIAATIGTGMYGQLSESSLYQERVIIHFEMRLKIIEATLEKGGTYQIPLCSANKFSLLHNPTDNVAQAIMGHYYETVGHILAQPNKPKVVCATRSYNSSSAEASIQEGEILFLSPNIRTKPFKSGKFLKCYNVITNEEKLLHENCVGGFTTQPERIKMSLKDIWESKYTNPPLKVIMYHHLPHVVLVKHVQVTLLSESWEDSVIATKDVHSNPQNESLYGNAQLLRFVREVGINLIPDKEENIDPVVYKSYCEETCHLFNEFDYSRIQLHLFNEDPVWPNHEEIQSSLYTQITQMDWERFVLLKKPENAFKTLKRRKSTKSYSPVLVRKSQDCESLVSTTPTQGGGGKGKLQLKGGEGDYELLNPVSKEEINGLIGVRVEDQPIPDVASLLHEVNTVNRQMMIQVESLRAEVEGLKMELKQTKNMMLNVKRDLTSSIGELKDEVLNITQETPDYVTMENPTISTENENAQILKTFTPKQVIQALEKLNLERCKAEFEKHNISGMDLAGYNVEMLENVLGVNRQLDIVRLMKLIQGCPSTWKFLEEHS